MNIIWSRLLSAAGLRIDFYFNFEIFLILSGAVLVLLALAALTIVRKILRLNVLNELQYE
ncbi:hypothetical protein JNUCC1_02735 [Lentibacillus sp. JNUCC-1]|uniref:hypothetical protein n=1 Tax=Lentibacillus sp. JNUCC-1 TaxID=2654513 RepID=UPI0012E87E47|nr:hypothetical protein [Lentibacillus sp. JNUCC-1]MUV38864.1 hypothetical protein [Lentibacillus sp. JNUCC-1]